MKWKCRIRVQTSAVVILVFGLFAVFGLGLISKSASGVTRRKVVLLFVANRMELDFAALAPIRARFVAQAVDVNGRT